MLLARHSVSIKENREVVWKFLLEQAAFTKLDSRLEKIEHPVRVGSDVTLVLKNNSQSERKHSAKITEFAPPHLISWSGKFFPFGLCNFEETVSLTEVSKKETQYTRTRELKGAFASLIAADAQTERSQKKLESSMQDLKNFLEKKSL